MSENKKPFRITGPRFTEKRPCAHACYKKGEKLVYVWPTTEGVMTVGEMEKATGVKVMTIYTRIRRYGFDQQEVFSKEHLPHGGNKDATPKGKAAQKIEQIKVGTWEAKYL